MTTITHSTTCSVGNAVQEIEKEWYESKEATHMTESLQELENSERTKYDRLVTD